MNAKKKGNKYECDIAKVFRDLGYSHCQTARYESKFLDDNKVDLTNTGSFHVQTKAQEKSPPYHTLLKEMLQREGKRNIIFHKRNRKGTVVVMSQEDFIDILKLLIDNGLEKTC